MAATIVYGVNFLQQGFVFLLLMRKKGNLVDVFRLWWQFEVDKLHVLLAAQAEILHERLQDGLGACLANCKRPGNDCVEHVRLLDAAGNPKELELRMKIPDVVHTERVSLG